MKHKLLFLVSKILHWIAFVILILFEFLMLNSYKYDKPKSAHSDLYNLYNLLPTFTELLVIFIVLDIIMFILCVSITIIFFKSKRLNKRNNMNK